MKKTWIFDEDTPGDAQKSLVILGETVLRWVNIVEPEELWTYQTGPPQNPRCFCGIYRVENVIPVPRWGDCNNCEIFNCYYHAQKKEVCPAWKNSNFLR